MAATKAAEKVVEQLKQRAAMIWDITPDAVEWRDGQAFPAGANAGSFEPLPLAEIALKSGRTGGPISAEVSINAQGAGPGFATHICDVEVDKETGYVKILRHEAARCDRCARAAARRGIRRPCHCEEQSDEAISIGRCSGGTRLLRCARNDSLDVEARGFLEMARVHFSGEAARRFTGGLTEIEV